MRPRRRRSAGRDPHQRIAGLLAGRRLPRNPLMRSLASSASILLLTLVSGCGDADGDPAGTAAGMTMCMPVDASCPAPMPFDAACPMRPDVDGGPMPPIDP